MAVKFVSAFETWLMTGGVFSVGGIWGIKVMDCFCFGFIKMEFCDVQTKL